MPGNVVCMGAMCQCTQGASPTPLTVTSQQIRTIAGMLVATVKDNLPGANITPFGACAASGAPCAPALPGPWAPGSTIDSIMNLPVLTAASKLVCTVGGEISISNPNCNLDSTVM